MTQDIRIFDQLSTSEIFILISGDPNWCLPKRCRNWQRRMDDAFHQLDMERAGANAGGTIDKNIKRLRKERLAA